MSRERELLILEEGEETEVSENELEEELAKIKSGRKCSHCNRPCRAHKGPTGPQCGMDRLKTEAQTKEFYKKKDLRIKKNKNKTPGKDEGPAGAQKDQKRIRNGSKTDQKRTKNVPRTRQNQKRTK